MYDPCFLPCTCMSPGPGTPWAPSSFIEPFLFPACLPCLDLASVERPLFYRSIPFLLHAPILHLFYPYQSVISNYYGRTLFGFQGCFGSTLPSTILPALPILLPSLSLLPSLLSRFFNHPAVLHSALGPVPACSSPKGTLYIRSPNMGIGRGLGLGSWVFWSWPWPCPFTHSHAPHINARHCDFPFPNTYLEVSSNYTATHAPYLHTHTPIHPYRTIPSHPIPYRTIPCHTTPHYTPLYLLLACPLSPALLSTPPSQTPPSVLILHCHLAVNTPYLNPPPPRLPWLFLCGHCDPGVY